MSNNVAARDRRTSFAIAFYEALHCSLKENSRQSVFGNYVFGLAFSHLMDRLRHEFGEQIYDPPVAEAGVAALGVGSAMAGAPAFVDLAAGNFGFLAWSPIVNEASVVHYLSNGELTAPVVFHFMHGMRGGGVQHSFSPQSMLWNVPGLEIALPSTPYDVKGLMRRALRSKNPTICITHTKLLATEGDVPVDDYDIPFGTADIKRPGRHATLVATSYMVQVALGAAELLAAEGIEIEVVDPRTLVPLDEATIIESVGRTGRLAVLDECNLRCGVASEITATIAEKAFGSLKAPPLRLTRADVPVPFSKPLEAALLPDLPRIVTAMRGLVRDSAKSTGR